MMHVVLGHTVKYMVAWEARNFAATTGGGLSRLYEYLGTGLGEGMYPYESSTTNLMRESAVLSEVLLLPTGGSDVALVVLPTGLRGSVVAANAWA